MLKIHTLISKSAPKNYVIFFHLKGGGGDLKVENLFFFETFPKLLINNNNLQFIIVKI